MRRMMKQAVLGTITAAVLAFGVQPGVFASDHYGTISVDGYAMDTYAAQEAIVMVTNRIERDTLADAKAEHDRMSAAFRNDLTALGISEKDIKTNEYAINDRQQYMEHTKTYKTTYEVTNSWQITVRDLTKTSKVIDRAAARGISDVHLASADLTDQEKQAQEQRLLIEAARDARQKADALAAALGTRVIGVESLNQNHYSRRNYPMMLMARAEATQLDMSESSIDYGDKKADMTVNVVFKVK